MSITLATISTIYSSLNSSIVLLLLSLSVIVIGKLKVSIFFDVIC